MGLLVEDLPCCNYYICWISGLDIWKVEDKFTLYTQTIETD